MRSIEQGGRRCTGVEVVQMRAHTRFEMAGLVQLPEQRLDHGEQLLSQLGQVDGEALDQLLDTHLVELAGDAVDDGVEQGVGVGGLPGVLPERQGDALCVHELAFTDVAGDLFERRAADFLPSLDEGLAQASAPEGLFQQLFAKLQ